MPISLYTPLGDSSNNASISDSIIHSSDTDTKFRFPADNTVSIETAGVSSVAADIFVIVY